MKCVFVCIMCVCVQAIGVNRGVQGVAHTGQRSGRRALHQSVSEGSEATVNNAKKDNFRTSEYRTNQLPISVPLITTCLSG